MTTTLQSFILLFEVKKYDHMSSKSKNKNTKHDSFFAHAIRIPEVAKSLLKNHIKPEILKQIDTNHIEYDDTVFTSKKLGKRLTDILIKVKMIKGSDAYIYAGVEHQSSNDKFMPLRILEYSCMIWRQYIKKNPVAQKLPMIYYIILSNAEFENDMPSSMTQLFEQPEIAIDCLLNPLLINLTAMLDEDMPQEPWLKLLEEGLKRRRELDLIGILTKVADAMKILCEKPNGMDYITSLLCYNEDNVREEDEREALDLLNNILGKKEGKMTGSLARVFEEKFRDKWLKKWMKQDKSEIIGIAEARGEARGKAQGALNRAKQNARKMLIKGMDIELVAYCTDLSLDEVSKIKYPGKVQKMEIVLV